MGCVQVIKYRRFQQESDVFSLAVVLWEIIVGELPFANELSQAVIRSKVDPNIVTACLIGEVNAYVNMYLFSGGSRISASTAS